MENKEQSIDFKKICDHLIDAIYVVDSQGNTLYVNDAYLALGDIKREELVGKNIFDLNKTKRFYSGGVLPDVLTTGKRCEKVGTLTRTNTKVHITGVPVFDDDGHIKYAIATEKDVARLEELKDHLAELRKENTQGAAELAYFRDKQIYDMDIVIESACMHEAFAIARSVAKTDVTVLITGESGTGKEIIADAVYMESERKGKPFIKLNCSAIPANLLESELFGYEEGAFTGAKKGGKAGLFEIANGGTVLLDEVGDMPLDLQVKLLRVLQSKEVTRVGGKAPVSLDIRLIASTNKDLKSGIENGTFREDLYYRLNVVPITLKPLKERQADIEPLVEIFLKQYNTRYNKSIIMTRLAKAMMLEYGWPGNIRELKNVMERMVVINFTDVIDGDVVARVLGLPAAKVQAANSKHGTLKTATEALERQMIRNALEQYGSKRKAAAALGVDHSTLVKKCQRLGI
ncbi:MAG: sigma 54-interacting transcriptional regulator [Emergencia sp.]|nr:sigma 54-interacting transcriptional regulator [Emergencia sp.]